MTLQTADVTLNTDRRDCFLNAPYCKPRPILPNACFNSQCDPQLDQVVYGQVGSPHVGTCVGSVDILVFVLILFTLATHKT